MSLFKRNYILALFVMLALFAPQAHARATMNDLFSNAVMSDDLSAFTKWNAALKAQAAAPENAKTKAWRAYLETLRGLAPGQQIKAVNDYMNKVPYISDQENYGTGDHWATVAEFLTRGGDCEDYALAKYFSLVELGFDPAQMKLVILYDNAKKLNHTVLAITMNGEVNILDNQSKLVRSANSILNYRPIYAISEHNWWHYL